MKNILVDTLLKCKQREFEKQKGKGVEAENGIEKRQSEGKVLGDREEDKASAPYECVAMCKIVKSYH